MQPDSSDIQYEINAGLEGLADKHMAVPLHVHTREDEFWFVLDGEIHFTVGNQTQVGTAGAFVHIPRRVTHTFQIRPLVRCGYTRGIGSMVLRDW